MLPAAPLRPRASLARVLDDLGSTMLPSILGDPDRVVDGLYIRDPGEPLECPPDSLVLGIGVHTADDLVGVLDVLGDNGAAAVVVRTPVPAGDAVAAAVDRTGVAVLGLAAGATWAQLAAMVRTVLGGPDRGEAGSQTLGGITSGDLFAVANAVAALIDAPVTIEDRSTRVLAFSGRQDEADSARVATILGRQVPGEHRQIMERRGDFARLYKDRAATFIAPLDLRSGEFSLPRMAIAVRAGDEILGSIWAAVRCELTGQRAQAFAEAANLVALHLMHLRAGSDVERRLRADLVSTALEGGPGAQDAVDRLGLRGRVCAVLVLEVLDHQGQDPTVGDHVELATSQWRAADAMAVHFGAIHPRSVTAPLGRAVYAIMPVGRAGSDVVAQAARAARSFLDRSKTQAVIGVGSPTSAEELARSRADADRAVRVLRARARPGQVGTITEVHLDALLMELEELSRIRGYGEEDALVRLTDYDREHHANLVQTLEYWLEAFGDIPAAAERAFVHPNTFRYRLHRVAVVGGFELSDPDARFAVMLQLRMRSLAQHEAGDGQQGRPDGRRTGGVASPESESES